MRTLALAAALLALPASSFQARAQANANLAPGGIVDGAKATINAAEGTAPDGRPSPGAPGKIPQAATSGGKVVERGHAGARLPEAAGSPNRP